MSWADYIPLIRDLATELDLFNPETFDNGHPVFMALERMRWDMTKEDCHFVENIIGYYREQLESAVSQTIQEKGMEGL